MKVKQSTKKKSLKTTPRKNTKQKKVPAKVSSRAVSSKAVVKFDPLQRYLSEVSQYSLITREREIELGIRIQEDEDAEAAYELVTSNLRLVVKIALEFQRIWMQNLLDLIQEGNIGLMRAVQNLTPIKTLNSPITHRSGSRHIF